MPFFNDADYQNMFTLAIEIGNPRIILQLMNNLCTLLSEDFEPISELISLADFISRNNAYVEPLIKNAMIPAISDFGIDPPVVFNQSESTVNYANSS